MSESNRWLCVVDIKNEQEDYARLSQMITTLTHIEAGKDMRNAEFPIVFQIMRSQNGRPNPLILEDFLKVASRGSISKIRNWEQLLNGLEKSPKANEFSYYIRVDLSGTSSDLTNLRYLALLLHAYPAIYESGAIFLWHSWELSDSERSSQYFRISDFLHFIQEKYRCFYSISQQTPRPLAIKGGGIQQTFLPLLEINEETYRMLKLPQQVNLQFQNLPFSELYKAFSLSSPQLDKNAILLFQIGFRALFRNLNGYRYNKAGKKKELLELLASAINNAGGITPLDALLFGVLTDNSMKGNLDAPQVKDYLTNVQMFSSAIAQLLENIVFHSPYSKGVFTWRLHKEQENIKKSYPGYRFLERDTGLELFIADSNSRDSIVDHFLMSDKATDNLKEHKSELTLSDFFQEAPSGAAARLWLEARNTRPDVCHGLRTFAYMVNVFGGTFYVRSSPSAYGADQETYYYKEDDLDALSKTSHQNLLWMPGTQFSAMFRRAEFHKKGLPLQSEQTIFDRAHIIYSTTYHDLAQSLRFDRNIEPLFSEESTNWLLDQPTMEKYILNSQEKKDAAANAWKDWFNCRIAAYENPKSKRKLEYVLFSADLHSLPSPAGFPGALEPFCKGFLSSGIFQARQDAPRYIILLYNISGPLSRTLYQTLHVMHRYIDTSRAAVYFYQEAEEGEAGKDRDGSWQTAVPYLSSSLQEILHQFSPEQPDLQAGFPKTFPYLLLSKNDSDRTLFEADMERQASASILNLGTQGYKIDNTHMRLGNKVHLDAFYEMALFFENPNYAYYTAFLILQRLKSEAAFRKAQKILIYGYASYSRGIVWAMIQIWRDYLKLENEGRKEASLPEIEFVIYQNDLKLESDESNVQMYYSREDWQRNTESIWTPNEAYLIQIVPISSSLTTFNKMLAEFCLSTNKEFKADANVTAFWVRDCFSAKMKNGEPIPENKPTPEEEDFWENVDTQTKQIFSNSLNVKAQYLISVTSYWRNPIKCEKCFPSNPLLELPLVETDPTSTVPTQQFYLEIGTAGSGQVDRMAKEANDARVAGLRNNILYGHISRGHNHFQYYIQTRRYFLQEREKIADWLRDLADKEGEKESTGRHIDILVIPKQTSNVEFGQIVYENYFKGGAESIIVNTEKEFRSNFLAEYNGLSKFLSQKRADGYELRFHYADMSIDSGIAFYRASALVQSLFSNQPEFNDQDMNFKFDHIFLLFSRMSNDSKKSYVKNPKTDFHAYVELYISNMRSFGDSCIPCKLRKEAWRYYQSAAIKTTSAFWEEKYLLYGNVPFDSSGLRAPDKIREFEIAYYKMACTHRATYYLSTVRGGEVNSYFQALRDFIAEIQDAFRNNGAFSPIYRRLANGEDSLFDWFSAAIKIMARPFFSFDYRLRCAVLGLNLILTELFLASDGRGSVQASLGPEKTYLAQDVMVWVKEFAADIESAIAEEASRQKEKPAFVRLHFIQHVLLKGLADLKSNYILRQKTISRVFRTVSSTKPDSKTQKDFFDSYRRSILRLVHNSSDETKSLWLEHLLQFYWEYPVNEPEQVQFHPEGFDVPEDVRKDFRNFIDLLLVENNRPLLQGVQNLYRASKDSPDSGANELKKYHMRNVCQFVNLGYEGYKKTYTSDDGPACERLLPLVKLYRLLVMKNAHEETDQGDGRERLNPLRRYDELQEALQKVIKKDGDSGDILDQVLLFGPQQPEKRYPGQSSYYMISPQPPMDYKGQTKYDQALKQLEARLKDYSDELKTLGFALLKRENSECFDAALLLDNNYDELNRLSDSHKYQGQKIEPIYIYLPCCTSRIQALMRVREILMFRCQLVTWLEQDFNNNAISTLVQQRYWADTLAADKVGDHNEQDFIQCVREVLCEDAGGLDENEQSQFETDDMLGGKCDVTLVKNDGREEYSLVEIDNDTLNELRHWYLLCFYVNSRIARLYRTFAQEASHVEYSLSKEYVLRQIKEYYTYEYMSIGRECAHSLKDVFFSWIEGESSRRSYITEVLKVVSFTLDGKPDDCQGGGIEQRADFLCQGLKDYFCIQFVEDGTDYGYLSEYLAAIILDCCISALKVSQTWRYVKSGYKTFLALSRCEPEDRCMVRMYREQGNGEFDYFVIENDVYPAEETEAKSGPGMSQTAMRWYIAKLWRFKLGYDPITLIPEEDSNVPKVEIPYDGENGKYQIKLPILKPKGENQT